MIVATIINSRLARLEIPRPDPDDQAELDSYNPAAIRRDKEHNAWLLSYPRLYIENKPYIRRAFDNYDSQLSFLAPNLEV